MMNTDKPTGRSGHIGHKVLYGLVIALSALIIVVNGTGIIGVWAVERPLSEAAVSVLEFVENSAKVMQTYTARVDDVLETLQRRTTAITLAAAQLRESVTDKGLILSLMPEEKQLELEESASSVRDTFAEARETVTRGIELYRSVDRLPFVSLPRLEGDEAGELANSVDETQSAAESLRARIAEYRAGQGEKVERVEEAAGALDERIQRARDRVQNVDSRIVALEARAVELQRDVVVALRTMALVLTLLLGFVIWTQVEMIRQYAARWSRLGQQQVPEPMAPQPVPVGSGPVQEPEVRTEPRAKKPKSVNKKATGKKKRTRSAKKK